MNSHSIALKDSPSGHPLMKPTAVASPRVIQSEEDEKMTVKDLRKQFPSYEFYFFKDGREHRKAWLFSQVKSYEEINNALMIEVE